MTQTLDHSTIESTAATRGLAASGLAAAVLSTACCILPLGLALVGVGGTWLARLTALSPYQPAILGAACLLIGMGLWRAYRKPVACEVGSLCANPRTGKVTKSILWAAGVVAFSSFGLNYLVPYFV